MRSMVTMSKKTNSIALALLLLFFFGGIGLASQLVFELPVRAQVVLSVTEEDSEVYTAPIPVPEYEYIEITGGCDSDYKGECVVSRNRPSHDATEIMKLRSGIVLKVAGLAVNESEVWYHIEFDEWLRYPERVHGEWYVQATNNVRMFTDPGVVEKTIDTVAPENKYILVDRSSQKLFAYQDGEIIFERFISSGLLATPTPRGTFNIYKKTPSRYMQGPLPGISTKYFDLPGVPWNLYFTQQGAVVHGAYWHDSFGMRWSNGCVNVDPKEAEELYRWADIGTIVYVQD